MIECYSGCYSFLTKSAKIKQPVALFEYLISYSFLTKSAKIKPFAPPYSHQTGYSFLTKSAKIKLKKIIGYGCVLQDFPTQYCKEKVHTFAPEIFL